LTNPPTRYFVDTNVIVYSFDAEDEHKRQIAIEIVDRLSDSQHGMVSIQVLKEFCSSVLRKDLLDVDGAEEMVDRLVSSWTIADVGVIEVRQALHAVAAHKMNYFDALILVTARDNSASFILTEDEQSAPVIDGVRYLNPFAPDFDLAQLS
jgi:predicted nucleic acid-binding protein